MIILEHPKQVQAACQSWKTAGEIIALVPTMGCLHDGHLKLVECAKQYATKTVVSIFVNPLQFGPGEDFDNYPRAFADDAEKLKAENCDLIFAPTAESFYPSDFTTRVSVAGVSEGLEGISRPGHFDGVATVVLKLFHATLADVAVFGEKDFQQLRVVQQMVRDLNLGVRIVGHPTVREGDGLALSSRNRYLSPEEREWAQRIAELSFFTREYLSGNAGATVAELTQAVEEFLTRAPLRIDYVRMVSSADLKPAGVEDQVLQISDPRLVLAAWCGKTRLIDNFPLERNR
jgi:pantoate--beta-alanine ligase